MGEGHEGEMRREAGSSPHAINGVTGGGKQPNFLQKLYE